MATLNKCFLYVLMLCMALAVLLPASLALKAPQMDKYWKKRATTAYKAAKEAYNPNPEKVTDTVNEKVGRQVMRMKGFNSTRRQLKALKHHLPCQANNPIDHCWRCDKHWSRHRRRLADCVIGFGHKTVGGKNGRYYRVTDDTDDDVVNPKPGTLRHAVIQKRPLWIVFTRSMVIKLKQELLVTSNKTIDARGFNVHIAYGAGITLQYVQNVIIHNLHIHDIVATLGGIIRDSQDHTGFRTPSDGDGISIFGASNIWIDHISMYNCADGLIDAIMGSTAVTISNCHFTKHNEVMLFGANDHHEEDNIMQITVAFNHFGKGLVQRMPRVRKGFVHVVNNDYTHWLMYAIGGSAAPTIISQGNRFIAPPNLSAKEVTKRDGPESEWKNWVWRSQGDLFMNGAYFIQSGDANYQHQAKAGLIKAKPGTMVTSIARYAGTLRCKKGRAC